MNVLIIGPFPPPMNGTSFANSTLYKGLLANHSKQLKCRFINTSAKVLSSKQGTKFSFKKAYAFIETYLHMYKIFNSKVLYITIGHTFYGVMKYAPFILLCKLLKIPYVIHVHGGNHLVQEYNSLSFFKRKIFHYMLSQAAAGIVLSKSMKPNLYEFLPKNKIYIVGNFVEKSLYTGVHSAKQTDKPRILYLSNLMREKGVLEFLDALLLLKERAISFHATLAGCIEDELEDEVYERIGLLGSCVDYIGTVTGERKKQKLLEANIFILPTYYKMEGQPISLLEGLATGNIIVTTPHSGIPDIIDETNGYFIKPGSPAGIAACLETISRNLPDNISRFSKHNTLYAGSAFSEESFLNNIMDVLHKTVRLSLSDKSLKATAESTPV